MKPAIVASILILLVVDAALAANANFQFSRTLRRGSSGDDVVKLQEFLKTMPEVYPEGSTAGFFGQATERAVKRFQSKYGIEPTGTLGPKTRTQINNLIKPMPIQKPSSYPAQQKPVTPETYRSPQTSSKVYWQKAPSGWEPVGTPPLCPEPFVLQPPIDFRGVTSVLYPGQYRREYKAHGGFRLDNNADNRVEVKVPFDALLIDGSRYIENGEVQYIFTFMVPCGIAYRFDHLFTLTPKFQTIANTFPEPKPDDSRTTDVSSPVAVKAGEVVATAVGFKNNVAVDFGVYDLRKKNEASKDPVWAKEHQNSSLAQYGACWLSWFSKENSQLLLSLPGGDSLAGKKSDYCK